MIQSTPRRAVFLVSLSGLGKHFWTRLTSRSHSVEEMNALFGDELLEGDDDSDDDDLGDEEDGFSGSDEDDGDGLVSSSASSNRLRNREGFFGWLKRKIAGESEGDGYKAVSAIN